MKWVLMMANLVPLQNGMMALNPPPAPFPFQAFETRAECEQAGVDYIRNNPPPNGILRHSCSERAK